MTELIGRTPNNNTIFNGEVAVSLKYLNNFLRFLNLPLINWEIEFDLSWSKECITSEIWITPRTAGNTRANPSVPEMEAR